MAAKTSSKTAQTKRPVAKKEVRNEKRLNFRVPLATVGKAQVGIVFEISYSDPTDKLGELTISQGGLRWKVGSGYPRFAPWEKFAEFMADQPPAPKVRRKARA